MDPITYKVLLSVYSDEDPALHLIGVCNYDLLVTPERTPGLHRELTHAVHRNTERFDVDVNVRAELNVLYCDFAFTPIDFSEMSVPDPKASATARIPKNVNTCINGCMRDIHRVLYPLTKPVGC